MSFARVFCFTAAATQMAEVLVHFLASVFHAGLRIVGGAGVSPTRGVVGCAGASLATFDQRCFSGVEDL